MRGRERELQDLEYQLRRRRDDVRDRLRWAKNDTTLSAEDAAARVGELKAELREVEARLRACRRDQRLERGSARGGWR